MYVFITEWRRKNNNNKKGAKTGGMKGEKVCVGLEGEGYGQLNLAKIVVSSEEQFYGLGAAGPRTLWQGDDVKDS